jgi:transcriptional regulator with XRE-family HTH domain
MVDRILLVLKIKNLTPSKFADEIGIQRSSMSHIMSGRNLPSLDLITKILNKYPDINSEWLLQGAGPMMKTIQIDLFEQPTESKTTVITEKTDTVADEPAPFIEKKAELQIEISAEKVPVITQAVAKPVEIRQPEVKQPEIKQPEAKMPEISQPEIKQVELKEEKKEVIREEKKTDVSPEPEIEKIVILYKNKTFKEYYPG